MGGSLGCAGRTWLSDRGPAAVAADMLAVVSGNGKVDGGCRSCSLFDEGRSRQAQRLSREGRFGSCEDRGAGAGWNGMKQGSFQCCTCTR